MPQAVLRFPALTFNACLGTEMIASGTKRMSGYHRVEIRPRSVETIHHLPQRRIESTFPNSGRTSPSATFWMPFGPSKTAVPPITSRTIQPLIVVGLASGTTASLLGRPVRCAPLDAWAAGIRPLGEDVAIAVCIVAWAGGRLGLVVACGSIASRTSVVAFALGSKERLPSSAACVSATASEPGWEAAGGGAELIEPVLSAGSLGVTGCIRFL